MNIDQCVVNILIEKMIVCLDLERLRDSCHMYHEPMLIIDALFNLEIKYLQPCSIQQDDADLKWAPVEEIHQVILIKVNSCTILIKDTL